MVKLLEKQYQEQLEEEVAKVSLWFVWKIIVVYIPFESSKKVVLLMAVYFFILLQVSYTCHL